jgi:hypothetical protein
MPQKNRCTARTGTTPVRRVGAGFPLAVEHSGQRAGFKRTRAGPCPTGVNGVVFPRRTAPRQNQAAAVWKSTDDEPAGSFRHWVVSPGRSRAALCCAIHSQSRFAAGGVQAPRLGRLALGRLPAGPAFVFPPVVLQNKQPVGWFTENPVEHSFAHLQAIATGRRRVERVSQRSCQAGCGGLVWGHFRSNSGEEPPMDSNFSILRKKIAN